MHPNPVFPALTAAYAAGLGLFYTMLSVSVVAGRGKFRVNYGDGGHDALLRRIRSHANFAEYVPFILLLVALLEAEGGTPMTIHALLLPLCIARLAHPIGMVARDNSVQQFMFRAPGAIITWIVLAASCVLLLLRVG